VLLRQEGPQVQSEQSTAKHEGEYQQSVDQWPHERTLPLPVVCGRILISCANQLSYYSRPIHPIAGEAVMKLTFLCILLTALGAAQHAYAEAGTHDAIAKAYKADIQQLCQGQKGKEAEQCLRSNADKLSADCKGAISKAPQLK
jgi:hypothetical protein